MVRPNLGPLGLGNALRPQANPVNTYFRPNLSGPQLQTITDLSPLSSTLTTVLQRKAEEDKEKERVRGEAFAVNNPELARQINEEAGRHEDPEARRKALQNAFAGLVAKGVIDEHASPFFQIGFAQSSAKSVMGEYRNRLFAKLESVATVVDGEDGLPVEPPNIDQLIADTYAELGDNAALRNFYGQQVSNGLKQSIDLEFRQRAADARGQAISKAHRDNLRNDLAQRWDTLALQDEITPEDLQGLAEFITTEVHDNSVREPRTLVFESIQLAAQRASEADPEEALRLLDHAEDLQVGGLALGDDAKVGLELARLKRDYLIQAERDEERALTVERREIQQALQTAELDYAGPLLDALESGDSVHNAYLRIRESIKQSGEYGKYEPLVLDQLLQYKQGLERARTTDLEIIDGLEFAMADGVDVTPLLRAAQAEGRITGQDYARYSARNQERQSIVRDVETNPAYQAALGEISREIEKVKGLAPEAQAEYDAFTDSLFQEWKDGYVSVVLDTKGDPEAEKAQRAYLTEKTRELRATVREREQALLGGRAQFQAQFGELLARHQDGAELLEQAVSAGTITEAEATELRRQGERAADRTPFYNAQPYREALSSIDTALEVTEDETILSLTPVQLLDAREALQDQMESRVGQWLDQNLASTEPRDLDQAFRAAVREARDETLKELVPPSIRRQLDDETTLRDAADQLSKQAVQQTFSDRLAAQEGKLTLEAFQVQKSPLIGKTVYDSMERFINGYDPLIGSPTQRSQVDTQFGTEFSRAVGRGATEEEQRSALLSYTAVMGMDPEWLLTGTAVVRQAEPVRAFAQKQLDLAARHARSSDPLTRTRAVERIDRLVRDVMFEYPVPLGDAEINPYSTPLFRSMPQMKEWKEQRPEDWKAVLSRFGITPDSQEERTFMKHQVSAISRISRP